jgi:hypothetical protein
VELGKHGSHDGVRKRSLGALLTSTTTPIFSCRSETASQRRADNKQAIQQYHKSCVQQHHAMPAGYKLSSNIFSEARRHIIVIFNSKQRTLFRINSNNHSIIYEYQLLSC